MVKTIASKPPIGLSMAEERHRKANAPLLWLDKKALGPILMSDEHLAWAFVDEPYEITLEHGPLKKSALPDHPQAFIRHSSSIAHQFDLPTHFFKILGDI